MKKLLNLFVLMAMLLVAVPVVAAAPPPQDDGGEDYVVVADDWLSKLSDKFLGDVLAYPAITYYTSVSGGVSNNMPGHTGMATCGPIQVATLKPGMGFRVVTISQIMHGHYRRNGAVQGQNVRWNKQDIRGPAADFGGKTKMGP